MYEVTLKEEFAKMNEITGSITFASGLQARASDKGVVDSLEGTIIWEYSNGCPAVPRAG